MPVPAFTLQAALVSATATKPVSVPPPACSESWRERLDFKNKPLTQHPSAGELPPTSLARAAFSYTVVFCHLHGRRELREAGQNILIITDTLGNVAIGLAAPAA